MRYAIAIAALAFATGVQAQTTQQCVCTSGCKIASDPFPTTGLQPTKCTAYSMPGRVSLATGNVVAATSIASSNSLVCLPPDAAYSPGASGAVACLVTIPAQPANSNVTVVITTCCDNAGKESGDSVALTFQSVQNIAPAPVPLKPRVTP
jgi:hypothetical protein